MRPVFEWNLGSRSLELGKRTLIMGVVNVTPDSFSDGGQFFSCHKAVEHAERLLDEGADIIDIGGESTRPGARVDPAGSSHVNRERAPVSKTKAMHAPTVTAELELERVIPVIAALKKSRPEAVISIDTYKAVVARESVSSGAEIVNDVSGLRWDPEMAKTVADIGCGVVLMHMRGRPEEWRNLPPADDIVLLVKKELSEWAEEAVAVGIMREKLVLDPGFGFGKNFEQNYPLLGRFSELHAIGFPLLAGTSRKSFIGRAVGVNGKDAPPQERLHGTLATEAALILKGAHIVRTHDVKPSADVARICDAIVAASANFS